MDEKTFLQTGQRKEQHMKILIVRHGDPDYSIDSLTEKGWKEAEYLSEKLCRWIFRNIMFLPWEERRIPPHLH